MHAEAFRIYCLKKEQVTESFPFGDDTLVFKVENKIFALLSLEEDSCNLKCNPELAIELRANYSSIIPGYHMNKKHWNTIGFNEDASDDLIYSCIDNSYGLVFQSLPKKIRLKYKEK